MIQILHLLLLAFLCEAQNISIKIWSVPMPPGWPIILAAETTGLQNPSFTWSFPGETSPKCTVNGQANVDCTGQVLDYTYLTAGTKTISVTVSASNMNENLVANTKVNVTSSGYEIAKRPEIRSMTVDQWKKYYVPAFYRIKDLGIYDHLAAIHENSFMTLVGNERTAVHGGPTFLPWHRFAIRLTERALQEVSGYKSLALPYMDWLKGWDGVDAYVGGNGDNTTVVPDGPFCNHPTSPDCPRLWPLPSSYPFQEKAIMRQLGADPGFSFLTQSQLDKFMAIKNYDSAPFNQEVNPSSFRNALEGWVAAKDPSYGYNHNGFHRWVGGTLGMNSESFLDPLFMLLHGAVDRYFNMWLENNNCGNQTNRCFHPYEGDPQVTSDVPGATLVKSGNSQFYAITGFMLKDKIFPWSLSAFDGMLPNDGFLYLASNATMQDPDYQPPPPPPAPPKQVARPVNNTNTDPIGISSDGTILNITKFLSIFVVSVTFLCAY